MSRTALVLAAHGSHHAARVNASIRDHADALAAEGLFDEVLVAFHQGEPGFSQVLDLTSATQVVVVPVMTSEGYYCDEVLPKELAKNARVTNSGMATPRAERPAGKPVPQRLIVPPRVTFTRPVGTHPRLALVVSERIKAWCADRGLRSDDVSVLLVGHGTKRNSRSRWATEQLAADVRRFGSCGEILFAFLDEAPLIDSIRTQIGKPHVMVIPFMIGGGPHALEDIPRRMGVREGNSVFVDAPIGERPEIRSLIRDLALAALRGLTAGSDKAHALAELPASSDVWVHEETGSHSTLEPCAAHKGRRYSGAIVNCQSPIANPPVSTFRLFDFSTFRIGTRGSALALRQARHVAQLLAARGLDVELVEISTSGDRKLDCAIDALPSDTPFTDDIDAVLQSGEIDFAVHALKDLPVPAPDDLELAAILPRGDLTESLVGQHGQALAELPPGARVGTSSPRRAAQLLALRPDLRPTPMRGAVDDRVRQVRRGDFDAAILATAGLQRLGLVDEIAETFSLEAILPAPGQGALVVQIRRGDERLRALLAPLDHVPTRRAVTTELEVLRRLQNVSGWTVAAWAKTDTEGAIELHARLVVLDGSHVLNVHLNRHDPMELAHLAAERLHFQSTIDIRHSTMAV